MKWGGRMERVRSQVTDYVAGVLDSLRQVIVGKDDVLLWMVGAILAGGHILLEDIPGVGKTTMALALASTLDLRFGRMQFTPDVVPSDVVGFSIPNREGGMLYRPGGVMCNLFLGDELNRASSRTQSALLEVMEEGQVTVDGVSHPVPQPFIVIATQNPMGAAGTQTLPDSQLDRFMVCLSLGYPSHRDEMAMILRRQGTDPLQKLSPIASQQMLLQVRTAVASTFVSDAVVGYLVSLVGLTRSHPDLERGASPRAALALTAMSKAVAQMRGRDFVVPGDVREVLPVTLGHRLILKPAALARGRKPQDILQEIMDGAPVPQLR